MAANKGGDGSKIPVFCSSPKPRSRVSNFTKRLRATFTTSPSGSKHYPLFGIGLLSQGKSKSKACLQPQQENGAERPVRPKRFVDSLSNATATHEEPRLNCDDVGRRVCVAGRPGVLRYLGKIDVDPGTWCGVELDDPVGQNDGSVRGVRYFHCPSPHGVLVPASKVTLVFDEIVSEVSESGPHSVLVLPPQKRHSMVEDASCSTHSASLASTPTPSSSASAGVPIWDWTLGSQHSSSAGSLVPSARGPDHSHVSLQLSKHSSFDFEESLGILTPDQMSDFTASIHNDAALPKTASKENFPFFLQELDYSKEYQRSNLSSNRSSAEFNFDDTLVATNLSLLANERSVDLDKTFLNMGGECSERTKISVPTNPNVDKEINFNFELMEQDHVKDLSEDAEMSEGNQSKKTSAMSLSYDPGTSNSDNARTNRSPSLEDLPMDKPEGKIGAIAAPSKDVLPPPTASFVNSVTSIASLDNGYQGDGEWSRPASRGADHSPMAGKMTTTLDPMTDSDFFTESDADMHDDTSGQAGSGTGRGDRRAQIIDGTLYGGVSGSSHHPPVSQDNNPRSVAFTPNTEEMDSSGIYSDLERKDANLDGCISLRDEHKIDETNENDKDFSPEDSIRTGSSLRSDMSQTLISPAAFTTTIMEQVNTIRNLAVNLNNEVVFSPGGEAIEDDVFVSETTPNTTDVFANKTVIEVKEPTNKKKEDVIKKYKMPKRNVVSKIKTMIISNPSNKKQLDENQENRRPDRTQKKGGRWDAVMSKIAQGKEEEKTKPSRLKEVKSRVFAGITNMTPPTPSTAPSRQHLSARGQCLSSRSLRDVSSLKSKSRRGRPRGSECSLPTGQSPNSQASSRNSSLSDVSLAPHPFRSKKRDGLRSTSPHSDVTAATTCRPAATRLQPPQKNGSAVCVAELKGSPARVQRRPVTAPARTTTSRDVHRLNHGAKAEVVIRAPVPQRPGVPLDAANKELRHAAHGVEALGVLLNYLVFNLDAFSTPQLKKDLNKMKTDWLNTKLKMEELKMGCLRTEEEKGLCQRRLEELHAQLKAQDQNHTEQVLSLNQIHQQQVQDIENQAHAKVKEVERQHSAELRKLREEHQRVTAEAEAAAVARTQQLFNERLLAAQAECDSIREQNQKLLESDKAGRYKVLQDEVHSLRAVLELRSAELQELRKTSEIAIRDAAELPVALLRVSALEARVEDLKTQLERKVALEQSLVAEKANMEKKVLREDSKNKRLSQYNEELQWKLKQSSEVFALIAADKQTQKAAHLMANLTTPKHCPTEHHLRNGNSKGVQQQETPVMKRVVEKGESVSWVVDLQDSPETMVNRIVRRAHSMRTVQSATSPAHHSSTLPNPHKRQRSRTTCVSSSHKPQRARSFSFDSDSSEVPRKVTAEWNRLYSPERDSACPLPQSGSQIDDMEDLIVVETVGEDSISFLSLEGQIDRDNLEVIGGDDFVSPRMSSSSGASDLTVRRRSEQTSVDTEEIFMMNRVDGLSFSLPKESAGEAMISEETSDNDSGARDSEEDERYSDTESLSGSASELVEARSKFMVERKIKKNLKHHNLVTKKVSELAPGSDSGSLSAATTAMDLSWSEDNDLLPSESEG